MKRIDWLGLEEEVGMDGEGRLLMQKKKQKDQLEG